MTIEEAIQTAIEFENQVRDVYKDAVEKAGDPTQDSVILLTRLTAVEKGVIKAMVTGPFAGYPVVDMKVTVFDGSSHDVDSSEFAFTEAARVCFRNIFMQASPELLEPIMLVEVSAPEEYMGSVTGSICQRRGRIESMREMPGVRVVEGRVPLSEMFGYSNAIRTVTQGRGNFTMHFEHYEAVPFSIAEEIIQKRRDANKIK